MNLLITAAGLGSRLRSAGLTKPKPLIKVRGSFLLEYVLQSFPLHLFENIIIIGQRKDKLPTALSNLHCLHEPIWINLDAPTQGQLVTAIQGLLQSPPSILNSDKPLLIHNCDTSFSWNPTIIPAPPCFATMPVFEASGNHWSFALPHESDPLRACEITEKDRISPYASIGLYGFASTSEFISRSQNYLANASVVNSELYIAPFLNACLKKGLNVSIPQVSNVKVFGTPSELESAFQLSLDEILLENG